MNHTIKIFLYVAFVFLLASCQKEENQAIEEIEEKSWDYIIVGDTTNSNVYELYDTLISPGGYPYESITDLDFNKDSIPDLKISAYRSFSAGGYQSAAGIYIQTLNGCEIIADTIPVSTKKIVKTQINSEIIAVDTTYYEQNRLIPIPLNLNDSINNSSSWLSGEYLFLCLTSFNPISAGDGEYLLTTTFLNGWIGSGDKYLGFRIQDSDKLYHGYIEIEVFYYNRIAIKRIVYR